MALFFGNNSSVKHYVGSAQVQKIYLGEVEVFSVAGGSGSSGSSVGLPTDPRGFRGWDPDINLGSVGDWFVATDGDDGAGDGSVGSPFKTLTHAMSVASAGETIKLRAGTYREEVTAKAGVVTEGYGTEKPIISAANVLTGLTRCDASHASVLGTTLGVNGSPVWTDSIPKSSVPFTDGKALNVHENGERMFLATDRSDISDLFARKDQNTFHQADSFTYNGNLISDIVDADVIGSYTDAQLQAGAAVVLYGYPNVAKVTAIVNTNTAASTITTDESVTVQGGTAPGAAGDWLYSIINAAPALTPGTFAVVDSGSNWDIYVYPNDEANIATIEYSAREYCVQFPAVGNGIEFHGIQFYQPSGSTWNRGIAISKGGLDTQTSGHRISHCAFRGGDNSLDESRMVRLMRVSDTYIERCTFYDILGRGVFFGGTSGSRSVGNKVERCHFEKISGAGFYYYDCEDHVEAHNFAKDTGLDAHSNKSNHYGPALGSHNLLFWGNEFENARGYVVWQNHSEVTAAFNWLPIKQDGAPWNRTLTDDNQSYEDIPVNLSAGRLFNNSVLPHPTLPQSGEGINIGRGESDIVYEVTNNVTHGLTDYPYFVTLNGNVNNHTSLPTLYEKNIVTYLANQTSDEHIDYDNYVETDLSIVYADAASYNFTPATDSPLLYIPGNDMSATVATLASAFSHFTAFNKDFKYQTISWDDLPVGADAGLSWDRTLPVLSAGAATDLGSSFATVSAASDKNLGTMYMSVYAAGATPSNAAIEAGTGAVRTVQSVSNFGAGLIEFDITGLSGSTNYTAFFVVKVASGQYSNQVTISFTTNAAGVNLVPDSGFDQPSYWVTPSPTNITGGQAHIPAAAAIFTSISQATAHRTPVTGGATYQLTCEVPEVTAGGNMRLQVSEYNAEGTFLRTTDVFDTRYDGALVQGQNIGGQLTAHADAALFNVQINKISNELDAKFDNYTCVIV